MTTDHCESRNKNKVNVAFAHTILHGTNDNYKYRCSTLYYYYYYYYYTTTYESGIFTAVVAVYTSVLTHGYYAVPIIIIIKCALYSAHIQLLLLLLLYESVCDLFAEINIVRLISAVSAVLLLAATRDDAFAVRVLLYIYIYRCNIGIVDGRTCGGAREF